MSINAKGYKKSVFFEHACYGRAVLFDPKNIHHSMSKKKIFSILDDIELELMHFVNSYYLINEPEALDADEIYDAMSSFFGNPLFNIDLKNAFKKGKMSFIDIYHHAFDKAIERVYESMLTEFVDIETIEEAEDIIKSSEDIIEILINRILFQEYLSRFNEQIIVVLDKFYYQYLYQLPSNVKGFVIRNVDCKDEVIEFAYAYEIPMVESQEKIKQKDYIIIDNYREELTINPKRKIRKYLINRINLLNITEKDHAKYDMNLIKFYAPIVDGRHLKLLKDSTFYHGMAMFRSEYYFMVKGILPLQTELEDLFIEVIQAFKTKDTYFRIPDFGEYKTLDYIFNLSVSINEYRGKNPIIDLFFNALKQAILETKSVINIVAPMIRNSEDIKLWQHAIKYFYKDLPRHLMPKFGIMIETESALMHIEDYMKVDFTILGLNDILEETSDKYNRYDFLDFDDIEFEYFEDIRYAHQHMRRTGIRLRHLISGNVLRSKSIFQKLINAGFTNYIIPISYIRMAEELLENHEKTRGSFVGVAQKRREEKIERERIKQSKK